MLRCVVNPADNALFKRIIFLPNNDIELYVIDNLDEEGIPPDVQKLDSYKSVCGQRADDKICRENIKKFGGLISEIIHVYDITDIRNTLRPVKVILHDHLTGIARVLTELGQCKLAALFFKAAMMDRAAKLAASLDVNDAAFMLLSLIAEKGLNSLTNSQLKQLIFLQYKIRDINLPELPAGVRIMIRPTTWDYKNNRYIDPYSEQAYDDRMFKFAVLDFLDIFGAEIRHLARTRLYRNHVSHMLACMHFSDGSRRFIPPELGKLITDNLDARDAPATWIKHFGLKM